MSGRTIYALIWTCFTVVCVLCLFSFINIQTIRHRQKEVHRLAIEVKQLGDKYSALNSAYIRRKKQLDSLG